MRKAILIGLGVVAAVVLVFVAVVAMQPSEFRIERSMVMAAPPEQVFKQVNDFHAWDAWSPWAKRDPNAKNSFEGPTSGKGAKFSWDGNDDVGAGSMTITESKSPELILIDLAFTRPMQDTSITEFKFKPQGAGTEVNWAMYGKQNFMEKAFCLFMDMDKMVGGSFEEGLTNIKKIAEAEQAAAEKEEPAPMTDDAAEKENATPMTDDAADAKS